MAKPSDHPVPQRIFHWTNLISMALLILTGFYIHRPFAEGYMGLARNIHIIFMYLIMINVILRVYYAFLGKHKDYRAFSFGKQDIPDLYRTVRGYLYIGPQEHNHGYNPIQKFSYLAYVILLIVQCISGILIYIPNKLPGIVASLGGLAQLRAFHYVFMWVIIAFIIVHFYMAVRYTVDRCKLMLFNVADEEERVISA